MLNRHLIAPCDLRQGHRLELVKRETTVDQVSSQAGDPDGALLRWLWLSAATTFCIGPITSRMRLGQAAAPLKAARVLSDKALYQRRCWLLHITLFGLDLVMFSPRTPKEETANQFLALQSSPAHSCRLPKLIVVEGVRAFGLSAPSAACLVASPQSRLSASDLDRTPGTRSRSAPEASTDLGSPPRNDPSAPRAVTRPNSIRPLKSTLKSHCWPRLRLVGSARKRTFAPDFAHKGLRPPR